MSFRWTVGLDLYGILIALRGSSSSPASEELIQLTGSWTAPLGARLLPPSFTTWPHPAEHLAREFEGAGSLGVKYFKFLSKSQIWALQVHAVREEIDGSQDVRRRRFRSGKETACFRPHN